MALFPDRPDVLTLGAWNWSPPGAKIIPYLHAFGSRQWDDWQNLEPPALGEQLPRGAWRRGDPLPQFQGRHFCGSPEAWLHGIPFAERPGLDLDVNDVPLCCKPEPYLLNLRVSACGCGVCTF